MASVNVVFIVLNSAIKPRIVCELAEKCYLNHQRTIICAQSENECKQIDTLLWTWKQHSFVPHIFIPTLSDHHIEPVVLTNRIESITDYDTLLMVDPLPIDEIAQFQLVIDFAEKYESVSLDSSRKRYKLYRDQHFHIETMQPGEFLHSNPHKSAV